jgi:membrane protease YdiL (CAAX protease family)
MTDDHSRCKECFIQKKKLNWKIVIKRNKILLGFVAFLWLFAVFPGPFLPNLDPTFYTATLIAAILFMIPVGFMLFFWSLNPPTSDIKKE